MKARYPGEALLYDAWVGPDQRHVAWQGADPCVKFLCAPCNEVRLSRLEARAKPAMIPLMGDERTAVVAAMQTAIAQWSVKTTMVLGFKQPFYPKAVRRQLLDSATFLPENTVVWIGRHTSDTSAFADSRNMFANIPDGVAGTREGHVATFAISHLAIQVLSIKLEEQLNPVRMFIHTQDMERWSRCLAQIWPMRGPLSWPPPDSIDFDELLALSGRFLPPGAPSRRHGATPSP